MNISGNISGIVSGNISGNIEENIVEISGNIEENISSIGDISEIIPRYNQGIYQGISHEIYQGISHEMYQEIYMNIIGIGWVEVVANQEIRMNAAQPFPQTQSCSRHNCKYRCIYQ